MNVRASIEELNHREDAIVAMIYPVFQRSYRIEAKLIGIEDFPPLRRTLEDLQTTDARFFGCLQGGELAGVVEVKEEAGELSIDSLVVDPAFFRQGVGSRLMSFVLKSLLSETTWETAIVETAAVNEPAIALYRKLGFVEVKRWVPSHGIPKVLLRAGR